MAILVERSMLLAKVETTYGQDANPTPTADFIAVSDLSISPNVEYRDPAAMDGSLSPRPGRVGMISVEVTFTHELQPNDTSPANPPVKALLQACGLAYTSSGTPPTGTFKPISTGFPSVTLYIYYDGLLWKIRGCRGTATFNFTAGEFATIDFTFNGLYSAPVDASLPTSWTDNGGPPLACLGATCTWNGEPLQVETVTLDMGNNIELLPSIASNFGVYHVAITNRDPSGTINPEMTTVATKDWHTLMMTPTLQELVVELSNGTSKMTLTVPKAQITNLQPGDRNGIRTWDIDFKPVRNAGDDEFQIEFGPAA